MFKLTVVAEAVNKPEELDFKRDLRRALAVRVVAGQAGTLTAAVAAPDEAIEEVAELGDELELRQVALHLLPLLPHKQQSQHVQNL